MQLRWVGYICSAAALINLLHVQDELPGISAGGERDYARLRETTDRLNEYLWPLALGLTIHTLIFFRSALEPLERMGIFYNTVFKSTETLETLETLEKLLQL